MASVVTATEARVHFGELMRRVADQREPVYVERDGKPQVVLLAVGDYEQLVAREEPGGWLIRAQEARERIRAEVSARALPPVEEILRKSREERDEQLSDLR